MKLSKQKAIYGDSLFAHKPTLKSLMFNYFYDKLIERNRHKVSVYRPNKNFINPELNENSFQIKNIAIVIDGKVVELLRMQSYAADLLMNESADLIEFDPKEFVVKKGMSFNGEGFE